MLTVKCQKTIQLRAHC